MCIRDSSVTRTPRPLRHVLQLPPRLPARDQPQHAASLVPFVRSVQRNALDFEVTCASDPAPPPLLCGLTSLRSACQARSLRHC
eukprot:1460823-Rhodomonas_salina.1